MANDLNRSELICRITHDFEARQVNDKRVVTLSVATNESWKDKSGQKQEAVEYHRIVLWSPLCELAEQYLSKGSQIYVEGKLKTRKWNKDGVDHYTTEIHGKTMQFLGGGRNQSQQQNTGYQQPAQHANHYQQNNQRPPNQPPANNEFLEDD